MACFAGVMLIVSVARLFQAPWVVYLLTLPAFFGAFSLSYQGLFKTCTFMAADGIRDLGEGRETIANPTQCESVKRLARRVNVLTISSTVIAAGLLILASR